MKRINKTGHIFFKTTENTMLCDNSEFLIDILYIAKNIAVSKGYSQSSFHKHVYYEVHIITAGQTEFELENKKRIIVKKGQFIIFPPEVRHRVVSESADFDKTAFAYKLTEKAADSSGFYRYAHNMMYNMKAYKYTKNIKALAEDIIKKYSDAPYGYMLSIRYNTVNIILEMLNIIVGNQKIETEHKYNDKRINEAVSYIKENISALTTVSEVADHIHISSKQLTRIFKKATGVTPGNFIKNQRIQKIGELLGNLDLSLDDIAEAMSFNDLSSLIKLYKRAEGITPGKSRDQKQRL